MKKYIVVWQAGYTGESDLHECGNYWTALDWMTGEYTQDEIDDNHIAICCEIDGERSYEV